MIPDDVSENNSDSSGSSYLSALFS
jgi:hypothetical protein